MPRILERVWCCTPTIQPRGPYARWIVARVIGRRGGAQPDPVATTGRSSFARLWSNWLPGLWAESIPVAAGSPWEHGYIESFHSRLRDEFLECVEFEDVGRCPSAGVLVPARM